MDDTQLTSERTRDLSLQFRLDHDEPFRNRLIAWLAANGIDADQVPAGERPSLVDDQLTVRVFTLSAEGHIQVDPAGRVTMADDGVPEEAPLTHVVTVSITVQPDADVLSWLIPPCSSCGR